MTFALRWGISTFPLRLGTSGCIYRGLLCALPVACLVLWAITPKPMQTCSSGEGSLAPSVQEMGFKSPAPGFAARGK